MKYKCFGCAILVAAFLAVPVGKWWPSGALLRGQNIPQGKLSVPVFEVDPAWPKIPAHWKLGDISSIAVDAQDHILVLQRPRTLKPEWANMVAPPVVEFDEAGNFIKAWGGAGPGYEWPEQEHGIYVDYKGYVWIGGNNCVASDTSGLKPVSGDQLLKFRPDGQFVMQIGRMNQSRGNADTHNLHRPADQWVYPPTNELFVADGYGNHPVIVFDADTGKFKRMWGAFGNKPLDDDHCNLVLPLSFSDPGPPQFSTVHAIRVAHDGTVYVADRENRRVQMFTKDGKFLKQLEKTDVPFARDLALSADAEQQFL
jgi:DNA-binding beta-propeller fold protein YncE